MTKSELMKHLAEKAGVTSKQAEAVYQALAVTVLEHMRAGHEIGIAELGKFGVAERAAKMGRHPQTGEAMHIAAKRVPKFTAAKALKEAALG